MITDKMYWQLSCHFFVPIIGDISTASMFCLERGDISNNPEDPETCVRHEVFKQIPSPACVTPILPQTTFKTKMET